MKKILVPFDFSNAATNAFRFALDIAEQSKGTVHLLHVVELPVVQDPVIIPVMTLEQSFLKEISDKAQTEFDAVIKKYNTAQARVQSTVEFGQVSRMIKDYTEKNEIDVIVMGSRGASGLKELLIGSNAEKVVRHAVVPVLVVKNLAKGTIKNIVFPNTLDTENQEDLTMKVKALQHFFQATVHIVYINTPANFTADTVTLKRLNAFAKKFMFKDFTINVYNHPYEEEGILHFTRSIDGDLIAMGTHGKKGIAHLLSGSVAEDVVNHTECPIWTYAIH